MRRVSMQVAGVVLVLGLASGLAQAEDFQRITGELAVEVENDLAYEADDSDNELNDLFPTVEANVNAFATQEIYLNTHLTLEPTRDPDPGEDRYFEDIGLYVEAITLNYESDSFHFYGGKFGPNFSIAYDAAPGLFGTDISEDDIEISERIGAGGGLFFGNEEYGMHALSASVFFADTTVVSESAFTNRGRVRESDGGPSNTESPESFAIAIDGGELPDLPGLRYHAGFVHQAVDRVLDDDGLPIADTAHENRIALAGEWAVTVNDYVTVTPLLEYVHFWNAGGLDMQNRDYLTASTLVEYENWNLSAAYTGRFIHNQGAEDFSDYQFQVSAGYSLDFGLEAGVGWKISEEEDVQTQVFGLLLAYVLEF